MRRQTLVFLCIFALSATVFAASDAAFTRVADSFDFPVGKPNAEGFHKARGFRANGHLGEDWNGGLGGDSDLGSPIYGIGNGIVVLARDVRSGWGNVVIIRHSYYENGRLNYIDSLYGHLDQILVHEGQIINRGQKIATMGNNHGMYPAHLHLEIRKNLTIGMNRASFARDFSNYYDPTQFIQAHRSLRGGPSNTTVAMNTFSQPQNFGSPDNNPALASSRRSSGGVARHTFKVSRFGELSF
jgi:murein DD-endopeptidase MepM/ murein hydrolase activator NlpD